MIESFAHLHVHSDFTLSKGGSKVKHLVAAARKLNLPAMALVDDGNMFGAMEFSKAAAAEGVQPVIGTKLWMDVGEAKGSVLLFAQDEAGYAAICSVLSRSHRPREGYRGGEGLVDPADFEESGTMPGVILVTGGKDGVLTELIRKGRDEDARAILDWLRGVFCDRIYVEIGRHGDESADEVMIEEKLLDLVYASGPVTCGDEVVRDAVPIVATSQAWYATADRHDAYEILKSVESKGRLAVEDGRIKPSSGRRFHIRSAAEMKKLFADLPEAYENAGLLARRCAFKVKGRKPILPTFESGAGRSEADELRFQARQGLEQRLEVLKVEEERRPVYRERLEYELGIIERMQFPGYFLIVSDFINWAKRQSIPVGPGRGSGAGSLVAYSLQITDLDPLAFGLLFERFLNPERVSMPDFDIDFCQDRRDEVIRYVREKYGEDYVSMIATFGEIKSKTAVKDVGRVMQSDDFGGYGFSELDRITKLIPMNGPEPMKLRDAMEFEDDRAFREHIDSDEKYRVLIDSAVKIEGLYRSQGLHAAGVVIAGRKLDTLVPVGWDIDTATPVSQFNMKASEDAGLVKFDFLGLKTLSVIRETLSHIKETTGEDVDLGTMPLDDAATYEMLAEGYTNGVFQFESEGMKKWMRALKPTRFEDLIAMAALYRPGPMDMIPTYVDCKNGKAEPKYPEPVDRTKPFLEETFGIMVYQEQVMQVAQVVAGYSLGGADLLRRAMGKKIPAEMAAQRDLFVKGATESGTANEKTAGELFDLIAKFAGYGFNKSHAAAYALIAYHTAWLKRHYPSQFMSALLTYETSDPKKMARVKEDMDAFGIPMLPPCIDRSHARFRPERAGDGFGVRFGLSAIKGISGDLGILYAARKAGPFRDLTDYHARAGSQFNKGQTEKLVEAGAFDALSKNRYSALNVLSFLAKGGKRQNPAQDDLFGGELEIRVPKEVSDVKEWGNRIDREFNAVGFYFGEHPLDTYEPKFRKVKVKRKASLRQWMVDNGRAELKQKRMAGLVEIVERKTSGKSGKPFVYARFAEKQDFFEARFFGEPGEVERLRTVMENAKAGRRPVIVVCDLAIQEGREGLTVWGRDVFDADEILAAERGKMKVTLDPEAIILSTDETKPVRTAEEALRQGSGSADAVARAKAGARHEALKRKVGYVKATMDRLRADEDPAAVEVMLSLLGGGDAVTVALEGRYLMDQAAENALKATDGIVSVAEEV